MKNYYKIYYKHGIIPNASYECRRFCSDKENLVIHYDLSNLPPSGIDNVTQEILNHFGITELTNDWGDNISIQWLGTELDFEFIELPELHENAEDLSIGL